MNRFARGEDGIRTLRPLRSQDALDYSSLLGIYPGCVYVSGCLAVDYAAFRSVSKGTPGSSRSLSSASADSPKNGISGGRMSRSGLSGD